jgi:hypothetical protein
MRCCTGLKADQARIEFREEAENDRAADVRASIAKTFESRRDLICSVMSRIVVAPQTLSVTISHAGLCSALNFAPKSGCTDKVLEVPFTLRRRGVEARLVIAGDQRASTLDRKLIATLAQAHEWMARLSSGQQVSIASLARELGLDDGEISRVLPLAFLAPDIVSAILSGRQPVELTARHLKRTKPLPLAWADQQLLLGFASAV